MNVEYVSVIEKITGSKEVDANAMLEYYQPLISWLEEENAKEHAYIGWDGFGKPFTEYHFLFTFNTLVSFSKNEEFYSKTRTQ